MPSSFTPPVVLLDSEEVRVETFRKFGIEYSPDQNIPQEALQVIDCLARACLPIIGEHCRDAIRLHEAKLKVTGERTKGSREADSGEKISTTIENIQREHKRLTAQKEVDRTVAISCQTSAELLNRGAQILQKSAPLLPVPRILSEHLESLKQIQVPKLVRAEGSVPSLSKLIEATPNSDEVAKYSVLCFLQKRVFDYSDGERAICVLRNAISEINADLQRLGSTPQDDRVGDTTMSILAHVCALKKLSSEVQRICAERENVTMQPGESIAKKCTKILANKNSKLGEFQLRGSSDADQMLTIENLQENLVETIKKLVAEINSIEVMEDGINTSFAEICNSRELQTTNNLLPIQRNPYHSAQPVSIVCPLPKNTAMTLHETLLEDELETWMDKLEIDPQENSTALEYLASMEFGVDGSKIHTSILIPPGNIGEVVNELKNFETIPLVREYGATQ